MTKRRHRDDLALLVTGPVATEWVSITQAFAGEPGKGRAAGAIPEPGGPGGATAT